MPNRIPISRRVLVIGAAVVLAAVAVPVVIEAIAPTGCQADPSAQIAALPAGGTFTGTGQCFNVPDGLVLTKPVTIDGGSYVDSSTGPTKVPGQQLGVKPVIQVKGADAVTLENLSVVGGAGGSTTFQGDLVSQAGIYLKGSTHTRILNVTSASTFGDCMTIYKDNYPNSPITTNLYVDGFTCLSSGRFGISPSAVYGATLNNVTIDPKPNGAAIDFESDSPQLGAGAVVWNNLRAGNGIYIREVENGPITFNNAAMTGAVTIQNLNSSSAQVVTFNGGSLSIGTGRTIGVQIKGGAAVFNGTTFTRQRTVSGKPQRYGMWNANTGSSLTFAHCLLSPPLGINDATSTVAVIP